MTFSFTKNFFWTFPTRNLAPKISQSYSFLYIIMAPYVPRPPLVINCLDDKPWFPIGTRGQGYCVIALFLCRARHIVNTPSPQTLRCTVDKFSKTDKHQLGHTCNVLITSVQVFFGNVSLVYLHDDGFLYMCTLEPSIVFNLHARAISN